MHELQAIIASYSAARAAGESAVLATVIQVVGSAYRRPGARALITATGNTVGIISGGCLERDVAERARQVLASGLPCLVEYDTRGDEDLLWGLGLGCNGIVRVLIESLHDGGEGARALQFIAERLQTRQGGLLATVIASDRGCLGTRLLVDQRLHVCSGPRLAPELAELIQADAPDVLAGGRAVLRGYEDATGRTEIFFDVIVPPPALVIFGAEPDAGPVVRLAKLLGWHVTVVDPRARAATNQRFAAADEIILCRPAEVADRVALRARTAVVVMTHNFADDRVLMRRLVRLPLSYLGILGPRNRTARLLAEIGAEGFSPPASRPGVLHGPIGLDLGAETPEEIALAIVAEIQAVGAGHGGGFLRDRRAPIHQERPAGLPAEAVAGGLPQLQHAGRGPVW